MAHIKSSHIATVAGLGCASLMVPSQAFATTISAQQAFDQFSAAGGTTFLAGAAAGIAVTSIVSFFEMRAQEKAFAQAQHLACSKAVETAREQLALQAQAQPAHFALKNEYTQSDLLSVVDDALDKDLPALSTADVQDAEDIQDADKTCVCTDEVLQSEAVEDEAEQEVVEEDVPAEQAHNDVVVEDVPEPAQVAHRSFFEQREARGVPVIARAEAADGVDDWGNFAEGLDDDPSISCDPTTSRDLHEIAFIQLAHEAEEMYAAREQQDQQDQSTDQEMPEEPSLAQLPAVEQDVEVEVHDYSGNEDMWAQALAVLEETEIEPAPYAAPAPVAVPAMPQHAFVSSPALSGVMMAQPVMYVPAVPTYAVPVAYQTAAIPREKMSQISINNHVDELVKEELAKCSSVNVRRASLEIIDGESKSSKTVSSRNA